MSNNLKLKSSFSNLHCGHKKKHPSKRRTRRLTRRAEEDKGKAGRVGVLRALCGLRLYGKDVQ